MKDPIRVLIVDDSAFMRRAVERMLADSPAIQVVGTAANGVDAVELTCELRPDVVVMDVNMPRMDGLEALRAVMVRCPTPVLMMSTLTRAGASITIRALELGAVDFVDKSQAGTAMDIYRLAPLLRDKVLAVARAEVPSIAAPDADTAAEERTVRPDPPAAVVRACSYDLIAIGTSTGGPRALTEILPRLPAELGAGIVVAQHMPPSFTATLAERLDERSAIRVREAADGDAVEPGLALIAPGGKELRVERRGGRLAVGVEPPATTSLHHPSVDILFESVVAAVGKRAIGVVLTGMGQDGAAGLKLLQQAGARTLAESADTAVIDGMPGAARPAADLILPLHLIAPTLIELCSHPDRDAARSL